MIDQPDPWRLNPRAEAALDKAKVALLRSFSLSRARCFRAVFLGGIPSPRDREVVLADLRDFCGAERSVFSSDPLLMARRAGQQEVWQRISNYLGLTEDQVRRLVPMEIGDA